MAQRDCCAVRGGCGVALSDAERASHTNCGTTHDLGSAHKTLWHYLVSWSRWHGRGSTVRAGRPVDIPVHATCGQDQRQRQNARLRSSISSSRPRQLCTCLLTRSTGRDPDVTHRPSRCVCLILACDRCNRPLTAGKRTRARSSTASFDDCRDFWSPVSSEQPPRPHVCRTKRVTHAPFAGQTIQFTSLVWQVWTQLRLKLFTNCRTRSSRPRFTNCRTRSSRPRQPMFPPMQTRTSIRKAAPSRRRLHRSCCPTSECTSGLTALVCSSSPCPVNCPQP